jgi:hypothetical protein
MPASFASFSFPTPEKNRSVLEVVQRDTDIVTIGLADSHNNSINQ